MHYALLNQPLNKQLTWEIDETNASKSLASSVLASFSSTPLIVAKRLSGVGCNFGEKYNIF